jgi:hypothetical protein
MVVITSLVFNNKKIEHQSGRKQRESMLPNQIWLLHELHLLNNSHDQW